MVIICFKVGGGIIADERWVEKVQEGSMCVKSIQAEESVCELQQFMCSLWVKATGEVVLFRTHDYFSI